MTSAMFLEFLTYLDRKMSSQNRNTVLLLDQCAAHPKQVTLQSVKLVFLPANTTSHLQPLDAGIIWNAKHYFKGLLVRRLLAKIERKDDNSQISLLDALHFIAMAWDRVSPATTANCFGKCGVVESAVAASQVSEDTIDDWEQLGVECFADDFATADDDLATCGLRTVDKIVSEVASSPTSRAETASSDDEDNDLYSASEQPPSTAYIMHALDIIGAAWHLSVSGKVHPCSFLHFEMLCLLTWTKRKPRRTSGTSSPVNK